MSLNVSPYRADHFGGPVKDLKEEPQPPFDAQAGPESWRRHVWGSESLVRRGLSVLPSLRDADVYAEGASLDALEREVALIRRELAAINLETRTNADYVVQLLDNITEAIRLARTVEDGVGGVYIG